MKLTKTKKIIIAIVAVLVAAALTVTVLITTGVAVEPENKLFNDGLVPVRDGSGKWGYINVSGGVAVNFKYSAAGAYSEGVAIVAEGKFDNDANRYERYKIINNKDKCVNDKYYAYLAEAGNGRIIFNDGFGEGVMTREGKIIVDANYDKIEPFSDNGYSIVALNGKKGVINQKGELILPALYEDVEGLSYADSGDYYAFIVKTHKVYTEEPSDGTTNDTGETEGGVQTLQVDEGERFTTEYSLVNLSGRTVSDGWLSIRKAFYKGDLLTVKKEVDGKELYGFIAVSGKVVVAPEYTETGVFMNGLCAVRYYDEESEKYVWNYVDKYGETAIELNAETLEAITCFAGDGDIAPIKVATENGDKYAYIDRKGEFVTEAIYDSAFPMGVKTGINRYALASYRKDGKIVTCLINKKGEEIDFSDKTIIQITSDKIAISYLKDDKTAYAFMNYDCEIIQEFDAGVELGANCIYGDGYVVFKKRDGTKTFFGIMSKKGKIIIDATYTAIGNSSMY